MAGAEGLVLVCRLGRCFCFAEVSTGDPHPTTRSACRKFNPIAQTKKKKSRKTTLFLFGRGRRTRTSASAYASHTDRSATQFLAKFGTRRPLLAKNDTLYRFLNAQTLTGSHPFYSKRKPHPLQKQQVRFWQGQKDSNPRHAVLETAALPTELYPYINVSATCAFKMYPEMYPVWSENRRFLLCCHLKI